MRARTVIGVESMPGGLTRIVLTSYPLGDRRQITQSTIELPQDNIRAFVLDLCRAAGLPRPW